MDFEQSKEPGLRARGGNSGLHVRVILASHLCQLQKEVPTPALWLSTGKLIFLLSLLSLHPSKCGTRPW